MPEVFTCLCGGQGWTMFSSTNIKCDICDQEYDLTDQDQLDASEFNARREELKVD